MTAVFRICRLSLGTCMALLAQIALLCLWSVIPCSCFVPKSPVHGACWHAIASVTNEIEDSAPLLESSLDPSAFDVIAGNIASCLIQSDLKRSEGRDGASTGWTSWIDEASAFRLQQCINAVALVCDDSTDDYQNYLRWLQSSPSPLIVELSSSLRTVVKKHILNDRALANVLQQIDTSVDEFATRVGCRLMALPSGSTLTHNIQTPPGAMVYGCLLRGGCTRYRLVGSATRLKRRAAERQLILPRDGAAVDCWIQYGGAERNYQAVDMGSCLLLEVTLMPKGLQMDSLDDDTNQNEGDMFVSGSGWDPHRFLRLVDKFRNTTGQLAPAANSYMDAPLCDLEDTFCATIGGLKPQIDEIVRRVLDGRVVRPASGAQGNASLSQTIDRMRREEMEGLLALGLQPVKGLLLYGPPGCGKTALAREISTILDARPPKIVSAPELLDRWVGGSERLIRDLFAAAEEELRVCNGDPTKSALHVVVIDEIDAVFRKRSGNDAGSEITRASAVNQILAKLDGIAALSNVLVIGMTNRRELLDEALLRPGRLEVQVEICLPNKEGRREILQIHFGTLRKRGRLSLPLCDAIDGTGIRNSLAIWSWRSMLSFPRSRSSATSNKISDLADERWTGGFSGADIAGLVRCAGSIALARSRSQGEGSFDGLLITIEDVRQALFEVNS